VKPISITIPIEPMGAPRMTQADKWKQRPCVMRYRAFKDQVRLAVGNRVQDAVIADFSWKAFFEPPPSWSKKKRAAAMGTQHRSKPDRDNIDKALLDALFEDDKGIAAGRIEKLWGEPARIELTVTLAADVKGAA
jgi:Holliday junction resolvase RusA-like endonuclease